MAERFKALVLKTSVGKLTVGSNPSLSAKNLTAGKSHSPSGRRVKNCFVSRFSGMIAQDTYAIVNLENSPNVESVTANIALQPTKPGEETRVSFRVNVRESASEE